MDPRERLEAFWSGERPDQIPYTICWWLLNQRGVEDDPALGPMFDAGLRMTYGVATAGSRSKNVESAWDSYEEHGERIERHTLRTPVGEIAETYRAGWHHTYFLANRGRQIGDSYLFLWSCDILGVWHESVG